MGFQASLQTLSNSNSMSENWRVWGKGCFYMWRLQMSGFPWVVLLSASCVTLSTEQMTSQWLHFFNRMRIVPFKFVFWGFLAILLHGWQLLKLTSSFQLCIGMMWVSVNCSKNVPSDPDSQTLLLLILAILVVQGKNMTEGLQDLWNHAGQCMMDKKISCF